MKLSLPGITCLLVVLAFSPVGARPTGVSGAQLPERGVLVQVIEGIPEKSSWDFSIPVQVSEEFTEPVFGITGVPRKYSPRGIILDRTAPYMIRATAKVRLPAGQYRVLLRSFGGARLYLDGWEVARTRFLPKSTDGHQPVPLLTPLAHPELRPLPAGQAEKVVSLSVNRGQHIFRLEAVVGGKKRRPEVGELAVAIALGDDPFYLLGSGESVPLSDRGWMAHAASSRVRRETIHRRRRTEARASTDAYWNRRHDLARDHLKTLSPLPVPEVSGDGILNDIDRFIGKRLEEAGVQPAPPVDDWVFLRRVSLDVRGVLPAPEEIEEFLHDRGPGRRARWIDRMLDSPRWADHWVSYWQDVLAENPGLLKPKLNNTGPFRWWLHETFLDNLPADQMATELILMEGSKYQGGPAGFEMATENDVPMAAKATILGKAFMGIELTCARCHDAPHHPYRQEELFSLAAMLARKAQKVPESSSVIRPREELESMMVEVTLKPGTSVKPAWPFRELVGQDLPRGVVENPRDQRERLAALITSPRSSRFPRVLVNRLWKRYLGYGLVEPVDDWHGNEPSHPDLLDALARELVERGYDMKSLARLILNSHVYQRQAHGDPARVPEPPLRLFRGPARRTMSAEQLLDSLFAVAGKSLATETLNLDVEGLRPFESFLNLGRPRSAWEFTSLSNERDRPALSMPLAQSMVDLLTTFGWRESRQDPITQREQVTTVLQPLIMANGTVVQRVTVLSDDSALTAMCMEERPLLELVRALYIRVLTRPPGEKEERFLTEFLEEGYRDRRVESAAPASRGNKPRVRPVSWSNHLNPEATRIKLELERLAREGDRPTDRLRPEWRQRAEDAIWALVNSPEFFFVP